MALWRFLALGAALCSAISIPQSQSQNGTNTSCRCFPGDACWPSIDQWDAFNRTVDGKLVANIPLASACHNSEYGPYDAEKCAYLRSNWFDPELHVGSISSIMAAFFTNNTCNLFLDPDTPCTLGTLVSFAVNATNTSDYQATIAFAQQHNIRLVIRNTGHDYNGKSTGAGGLAIWTHFMKDQELVNYQSPSYTGKAVKMGAGVEVIESYQFAQQHGLVSVGGDCPTVGVVGGFTQGGGGHGPGVSKFGLGADQALEWEVVTGTGELLVANREQNQDLYWALTGGGGGTYGVVSSLTAKVYPDLISSGANFSFPLTNKNADSFWEAVETWQVNLLNFTGSGCFAFWQVSPTGFGLVPGNCPGLNKSAMTKLLQPTISKLEQLHIPYNLSVEEYPNFLESFERFNIPNPKNVSDDQFGAIIVPKEVLINNNTELVQVFRKVVSLGAVFAAQGVDPTLATNGSEYTSINPTRRLGAFNAIFATTDKRCDRAYNQTDYAVDQARANLTTYTLLPMLEKIIPNVSAYMNECDFQQPNWQEVLYGVNYPRLLQIKDKYDPHQLFYALQAVGSERWYENQELGGRLCPA